MSVWLESLAWWQLGLLWLGGITCGSFTVIGAVVAYCIWSDWRETRKWKRKLERQDSVRNQPAPRSGT